MRMPSGKTMGLTIVGLFVAAQAVQIRRDNPPVTSDVSMPPAVREIAQRSCYACHSNETTWPWYAYVAPASWLVGHDVNDGRRHLNFSEWASTPPDRRQRRMGDLIEEVRDGEMPPWYYVPLHREAKLSAGDAQALIAWAESLRAPR